MRFLVLNGPPGAGKTTIARYLHALFISIHGLKCITDSFAAPMKHFIAVALGEKYSDMNKDAPLAVLNGHSVREFLIDLSENYIKPNYGNDWFGKILYHRSLRYAPTPDLVICDDNGFAFELGTLGEHRPILIRVTRPGHSYKGDSRSDLPDPDFTIANGRGLRDLELLCDELALTILKEEFNAIR